MLGDSSWRFPILVGFQKSSGLGSEHGGFERFYMFGVKKVGSKKEHVCAYSLKGKLKQEKMKVSGILAC